jgi:uracil-DNA glycosylase
MKKEFVIEREWDEVLHNFLETKTYAQLSNFIENEYRTKQVFPKQENIFRAFERTPFSQVKVVIIGQDPYYNDGQACGLCFSVPAGVILPPSLKNIYKEIESDLGIKKDITNGNLEVWANQGVFLLNTALTVIAHTPASHKGKGWEEFTDTVITAISEKHEHIVFMLWGNYAQSKKGLIDTKKHLVLEAPHPSPLSAYTGFVGCKHFSKCNKYLKKYGKGEVMW